MSYLNYKCGHHEFISDDLVGSGNVDVKCRTCRKAEAAVKPPIDDRTKVEIQLGARFNLYYDRLAYKPAVKDILFRDWCYDRLIDKTIAAEQAAELLQRIREGGVSTVSYHEADQAIEACRK